MKKRILALLTTAALLLTTAALPVQAEPKPATDTHPVNTGDALDILKCIVGLTEPLPLDPYDFNENGVIDNGDALEVLKSIVELREVITLAVEPANSPTLEFEPLSEELKQQIRQDWVAFRAVPDWRDTAISWRDDLLRYDPRWDSKSQVYVLYHLGTYNGCVIFWEGYGTRTAWSEEVAGFVFSDVIQNYIFVWHEGSFYRLATAFEEWLLAEQDIAAVWERFERLRLLCPGALSEGIKAKVRQDWRPGGGYMGHYLGTYNGSVVFMTFSHPASIETQGRYEVAGFIFPGKAEVARSGYSVVVWNSGEFYSLTSAFEENMLTEKDIGTIWFLYVRVRNHGYDNGKLLF